MGDPASSTVPVTTGRREARWLPLLKILLPRRGFDYLLRRGYGLQKTDGRSPAVEDVGRRR